MTLDQLLPHQGAWRLLDHIVAHEGDLLVTERTFDEAYCEGHFPDQRVVPGVALLEAMAQSMLVLSRLRKPDQQGIPFLAGFDRTRFRSPVLPPATVRFEVRITEERAGLTRATGTAFVGDRRVATAQLLGGVFSPAALAGGPTP